MAKENNDKFQEITGFMYKIFPKVTFDSGYEKREFVIEKHNTGRDGKVYKDLIKFEATQSWITEMDKIGVGSEVKIHFTLGGKEWTPPDATEPKYINYLRCWKIEVKENTNQEADVKEKVEKEYQPIDDEEDSGLPF